METKAPLEPWIETGLRAAVSEIQRRNKQRNFVLTDFRGRMEPVMTTEEMLKILRIFLESSKEGLG